jgi:hypothetical protein
VFAGRKVKVNPGTGIISHSSDLHKSEGKYHTEGFCMEIYNTFEEYLTLVLFIFGINVLGIKVLLNILYI